MICRFPYSPPNADRVVGCGQCLNCRFNKRRLWAHRIMLESFFHKSSIFLTLTYDSLSVPLVSGNPTLCKADVQKFFKSFRKAISPVRIRYYLAGEYEDTTFRPHYHAIVFGIARSTRLVKLIRETWGRGNVYVGTCTFNSAQYAASYAVKKMTSADDSRLKKGMQPEFSTILIKKFDLFILYFLQLFHRSTKISYNATYEEKCLPPGKNIEYLIGYF